MRAIQRDINRCKPPQTEFPNTKGVTYVRKNTRNHDSAGVLHALKGGKEYNAGYAPRWPYPGLQDREQMEDPQGKRRGVY